MRPFIDFTDRSFEVLQNEQPVAYEQILRTLYGKKILLTVDDENVVLSFGHTGYTSESGETDAVADTIINTSRQALVEMIEGDLSMLDAMLTDRLLVKGPQAALEVVQSAVLWYVRGGLACPSFPPLVDALRE